MSTLITRLGGHRVVITDYLIMDEIPVKLAEIRGGRWATVDARGRRQTRPWPIRMELAYRPQGLARLLTRVATDLADQGLWDAA